MDNIFEYDVPRSKGRKQGLINTRLIIYILGVLVLVEAGLFALCAGVSLLYEEPDFLLNEEVQTPINYFSVLKAISDVPHTGKNQYRTL